MTPVKVGVVGCGNISSAYMKNLVSHFASVAELCACSDIDPGRAASRAEEFSIPRVLSTDALLADPEVELVVNLTRPEDHCRLSLAALEAGKHVFVEKPLAVTRAEGRQLLDAAAGKGLFIGGAADTFLGAGLQTVRKAIDDGLIGKPITAAAFIGLRYTAEFHFWLGAGPVFDMGPYYLTALVSLLGPVGRAAGSAQTPIPVRPHPEGSPNFGRTYEPQMPSTVSGVLDFAEGVTATITTTGEVPWYHPSLVVYGSGGTIVANDPNMYTGPVILKPLDGDPRELPLAGFQGDGRALGVAEMALGVRAGQAPRASGALMYHILDIMHALHESSAVERHVHIDSNCERPEPFDVATVLGG